MVVLTKAEREAGELVDMLFAETRLALENNVSLKLSGFGNFELRDKRQRPDRNPKTGAEVPITARRVVTFKLGMKLKRRVESLPPLAASRCLKEWIGCNLIFNFR
jgi:integration host factor subunit alpha